MTAPDAQPPTEPHDPTHLMYDADTGICCDCPRMVDPLAAPIAAALDSALSAFNSAVEFGTPDEVEHGIAIALRAAFRVVPPAAALAGTTTPALADEAEVVEAAREFVRLTESAIDAGWSGLGRPFFPFERLRTAVAALLASTPAEESTP